jgi:hypothetical protein
MSRVGPSVKIRPLSLDLRGGLLMSPGAVLVTAPTCSMGLEGIAAG